MTGVCVSFAVQKIFVCLLEWRSESNSGWILAAGVLGAVTSLVLSVSEAWLTNLVLFSLFPSEVAKLVFQLVYYRRGI